jgi:hypothetical protein
VNSSRTGRVVFLLLGLLIPMLAGALACVSPQTLGGLWATPTPTPTPTLTPTATPTVTPTSTPTPDPYPWDGIWEGQVFVEGSTQRYVVGDVSYTVSASQVVALEIHMEDAVWFQVFVDVTTDEPFPFDVWSHQNIQAPGGELGFVIESISPTLFLPGSIWGEFAASGLISITVDTSAQSELCYPAYHWEASRQGD